ncbi:MAG: PAS domain S-box protein, partial [Bacteroidales bacterium]|nr:PAS domain S-box protein [Bacteroidales bacterium]
MSKQKKSNKDLLFELHELKRKYDDLQRMYTSEIESHHNNESEGNRHRAEELKKPMPLTTGSDAIDPSTSQHNLERQMNQVEMRLQNEELRIAANPLNQRESLYKSLFISNHSVMLVIDPETGVIKDANAAACLYYGWSHHEICEKKIFEINPISEKELIAEMQKAKEEKRNHFFFKHRLANGEVRDVEVYSGPISIGNSKLLYSLVHDITERKIVEEKLRESEEKYRKLVESINDVIYEITAEGVIKYVSPSSINVLGYTPDEVTGKNILAYIHPDDRQAIAKRLAQLFEKDYLYLEYRYINKSGKTRWVRSSTSAIIEDGIMIGGYGTLTDITERKLAEEKLLESKQIIEGIINTIPARVFWKDRNLVYMGCNTAFAKDAGFTDINDVIGKDDFQFLWRDQAEAYQNDDKEVIGTGLKKLNIEEQLKTADGKTITLLTNKTPLLDAKGAVTGVLGTFMDISELKQAQEKLQQSEDKYRSIFENMLDCYYEATLEGTLLEISPSIEIISKGQYSRNQLIGQSFVGLYADNDARDAFYSEITKYGKVTDYELSLLNKDGSIIFCAISSAIQYDENGKPLKIAGILRDISERKKAENIIKKSNQKLEAIIASSPYGIGIVSLDGNLQLVSDNLATMYGYAVDEKDDFIGKPVFDFIDPSDHQRLVDNIHKLLSNELCQDLRQYLSVKKDGSKYYIELNSVVLHDANGKPESILYIQQDITERKKAEDELRESERKFQAIIQSQSEGIGVVDKFDVFKFSNLAAGKIFETDDLVGASLFDFLHPSEKDKIIQQTNKRQQGIAATYELRILTKQGNCKEILVSASPKFDENNNYEGAYAVFRDITQRKQSEKILEARLRLTEFSQNHSRDEVQQKLLDELEILTSSQIGFFHAVAADQKTLTLQSWSTNTKKNMCTAESNNQHTGIDKAGVWVDCIRQRKAVIHNDYLNLEHRQGLPDGHAPLIRELVVPVFRNELIVATVGVGNKPANYTEKDIEVVTLLADMAWDITERI